MIELEHTDQATEAELRKLYESVRAALPAASQGQLRWLARTSLYQETLAKTLKTQGGWWAGKVMTYDGLITSGVVTGLTTGITAGRLRWVRRGENPMTVLEPNDIALLETAPDRVPPVAAIITATPQTPHAHLNLLAAGRGTPNASAPDFLADPRVKMLAKARAPVVMHVHGSRLHWRPLSPSEWRRWLEQGAIPIVLIDTPNVAKAPYTLDLSDAAAPRAGHATVPTVGLIGGKGMGLVRLQRHGALTPHGTLHLTTRLYADVLDPLRPQLKAVIEGSDWQDRRARQLLVRGRDNFLADLKGDRAGLAWLDTWTKQRHPAAVARVVGAGGIQHMVRTRALPGPAMAVIRRALVRRFGHLAADVGLRFRSSSSVEDLAAFNGAGLYTSQTGHLEAPAPSARTAPAQKPTTPTKPTKPTTPTKPTKPTTPTTPTKPRRSVEAAIQRVLASYWTLAAVEERERAGIDHLEGRMAMVVHPRFEDAYEDANAVVLARFEARGSQQRLRATINVQRGAASVTNPTAGAAAVEVDEVRWSTGGGITVIRRARSSLPGRAPVLSDAELRTMANTLRRIGQLELLRQRKGLPAPMQPLAVVLDFELRRMRTGWLRTRRRTAGGVRWPPQKPRKSRGVTLTMVWKQMRPLSRRSRISQDDLMGFQVPIDQAAWATRFDEERCVGGALSWNILRATLASSTPLTDAADRHRAVRLNWTPRRALATDMGVPWKLHMHDIVEGSAREHGDGWIHVTPHGAAAKANKPLRRLLVHPDGRWRAQRGGHVFASGEARCRSILRAGTPQLWLTGLLTASAKP